MLRFCSLRWNVRHVNMASSSSGLYCPRWGMGLPNMASDVGLISLSRNGHLIGIWIPDALPETESKDLIGRWKQTISILKLWEHTSAETLPAESDKENFKRIQTWPVKYCSSEIAWKQDGWLCKGRFTRYDFVAYNKLTTGLRHDLRPTQQS